MIPPYTVYQGSGRVRHVRVRSSITLSASNSPRCRYLTQGWAHKDLNLGHADYESAALTN